MDLECGNGGAAAAAAAGGVDLKVQHNPRGLYSNIHMPRHSHTVSNLKRDRSK